MIDFKPQQNRRHDDVEPMTRNQVGVLSFILGWLVAMAVQVFISGVAG